MLGELQKTITPNKTVYIKYCLLGVGGLIIYFLFSDFYDRFTMSGIPVGFIILVVSPLLIAISIYKIIKCSAEKQKIEVYENGIQIYDSIYGYNNLTIRKTKGLVGDKYIFSSNDEQVVFNYSITKNDYTHLYQTISNHINKQEV